MNWGMPSVQTLGQIRLLPELVKKQNEFFLAKKTPLSKRDPDGEITRLEFLKAEGGCNSANQSGTLSLKVSTPDRGIALSDTKEAQLLYFRRAKMKTFSLTVRFKRINKIRRLIKQSDS